jgi:hypothetical protein
MVLRRWFNASVVLDFENPGGAYPLRRIREQVAGCLKGAGKQFFTAEGFRVGWIVSP